MTRVASTTAQKLVEEASKLAACRNWQSKAHSSYSCGSKCGGCTHSPCCHHWWWSQTLSNYLEWHEQSAQYIETCPCSTASWLLSFSPSSETCQGSFCDDFNWNDCPCIKPCRSCGCTLGDEQWNNATTVRFAHGRSDNGTCGGTCLGNA